MPRADEQLLREGIPASKIRFVGNVMIDSLVMLLPRAAASTKPHDLGLQDRPFVLVTLHRPSNVDAPARLKLLMDNLLELAGSCRWSFPCIRARGRCWTRRALAPGPGAWC